MRGSQDNFCKFLVPACFFCLLDFFESLEFGFQVGALLIDGFFHDGLSRVDGFLLGLVRLDDLCSEITHWDARHENAVWRIGQANVADTLRQARNF